MELIQTMTHTEQGRLAHLAELSSIVPTAEEIPDRINLVRDALRGAEEAAGIPLGTARLQIVVKHQSITAIHAALAAGSRLMGQNFIQQLQDVETQLATPSTGAGPSARLIHDASAWEGSGITPASAGNPPHWTHVIGHVQSNKAGRALELADCIETVDSLKLAQRLNRLQGRLREEGHAHGPFSIYVQVNSSGAASQYGVEPHQVEELVGKIAELPHLRVDGLMTIGANTTDERKIAHSFALVRELRDKLQREHPSVQELSMGMTHDMSIAVAEGSTQVRVGSAIFGPRPAA
ncbi:YggS family pyridoxal phosphate-dependent enzyme [Actinotignum sanguinis]|nr:YggS family pyridoxal phosphate-dependent enzyme [Actinotignum sanguinis]MDK8512275.1 YggS family pyridoxal phosphate-dependent enzyme [Actinotignum sanguinis]MDK8518199.1 YggS family pyridoxal phosphate-dependent enzyme [Actinotignum sanguinis]MDK8748253.1 YggS family pyridoxal phosphate-dependent enzyme [Actinotignum sanguinis]MDV2436927.1 YggS family pyridoxal phosphate-dependent enzyme [Actinotignum sanguinis]